MTTEAILTLIAGIVGGGATAKLIDLWRFRGQDKAQVTKTIHDSQTNTLTVQSTLLAQWITDASNAAQSLRELRGMLADKDVELGAKEIQLREALHAVNLCKDSLERCREKNGCDEML